MKDRFTQGEWTATKTGVQLVRIMAGDHVIATLDGVYKSDDELRANADLLAAAPRLATALAALVSSPWARAALKEHDPKVLEFATEALRGSRVLEVEIPPGTGEGR